MSSRSASTAWRTLRGTILQLDVGSPVPSSKVTAFDLDDTLVCTRRGKGFAKSEDDWQWKSFGSGASSVLRRLKTAVAAGEKIVIFSNQAGIAGHGFKLDRQRIHQLRAEAIGAALAAQGIPSQFFLATTYDDARKPGTGMWSAFVAAANGGVAPSLAHCTFVGDAAGRAGDHSDSDKAFAAKVGMRFETPEDYFGGGGGSEKTVKDMFTAAASSKPPTTTIATAAATTTTTTTATAASTAPVAYANPARQELVLFVGAPAAGKSTFFARHFAPHAYERVNQDALKSRPKCVKTARAALSAGRSVVVDNTNASRDVRAEYVAAARSVSPNAVVRCVRFTTPLATAHRLNKLRAAERGDAKATVPAVAYAMFAKRLEAPTRAEGFANIVDVAADLSALDADAARRRLFDALSPGVALSAADRQLIAAEAARRGIDVPPAAPAKKKAKK